MANYKIDDLIKFIIKEEKAISLRSGLQLLLNSLSTRARPDTVLEAKANATCIINYLETLGITNTNQVTADSINKYIIYSKKRSNKESTINKRIKALLRVYKFLIEENIISSNPLENFKLLKEKKPEIQFVDNETALAVIKAAYQKTLKGEFHELRNFYGLLIIFEQGIRLNELIHLHESNFDYESNSIKLTYTKTNTDRTIFLTPNLMEKIHSFVKKYNLQRKYLMVNQKTNLPIDKRDFAKWLNKIGKELNIDHSISPHKWRHGFATNSLQAGADLGYIKEILGHTSISTTEMYLHIQKDYLKEQHNKYSRLNDINFLLK